MQSIKLEKSTGRKSYILSARELSITWSNDPMFWVWKSIPESRSVLLLPFDIVNSKLSRQILIQNFASLQILRETSVEIGNQEFTNTAYLRSQDCKKQRMENLFYSKRKQMLKSRVIEGENRVLSKREDGWMEIELGEFFSGESDEEVKMSLKEIKGHQLKGGLMIEGIKVRPKS
ncbi:hypothetical protein CRYUN_Cryun05aG0008200 [Craigia yunnanensis]